MKSETYNGTAVLRQPGAVIVRRFVAGRGVVAVRVELPAGAQVTLGAEVLFERVGAEYLLTGGG